MRVDQQGIHVRQSDIGSFISCPEEYRRLYWDDTYVGGESDAALVGTSLHALIAEEANNGFFTDQTEAAEYVTNFFVTNVASFEEQQIPYNRESFKTDVKAQQMLEGLVADWWQSSERQFLMGQPPDERLVEWEFDVPFTQIGGQQVYLCGTSDLVLPRLNKVWDWKTAGRGYDLWEKQRWAIQPSVYLFAAIHEGHISLDKKGLATFEYKVFMRGGKDVTPAETYRVTRSVGSFGWLRQVVTSMVTMQLGMGTNVRWPLNDHGWHCSPKWCPFFDTCKGQYIDPKKNWV